MKTLKNFASLVKISHTVFALPFAVIGFAMGVESFPDGFSWWLLLKVLACMFLARTVAMAFNRYIDRDIDALNPRTASREIPAGVVSPRSALILTVVCALLFIAVAASINTLTLALSPVALLLVIGYSYTKRFTALCHLILGLSLGVAPTAAYISVTGRFAAEPLLLSLLVLMWCGGFDIIYALQDEKFDRDHGLHSIPAAMGAKNALRLSSLMHLCVAAMVVVIGKLYLPEPLYVVGAVVFVSLLVYQHAIVRHDDLSRVGVAFGTTNGVASLVYAFFTVAAIWLRSAF
ncbi:MAG: putative 4-hydroxybenzoate polyprenyltransferase [Rikenellaceae bacterium]|nr:putative 4-hydroxybenzoate polyprenyltransferase [Rikenellaceae bacterium]